MQIFQTIILAINFYPTEIPNLRTTWKPWRKFNVNDRNNLLNLTHCTAVLFLFYQVLKIWKLAHYLFANFLFLISISINGEIIQKDDCTNFHSRRLTVLSTPLILASLDNNLGILQTPSYQPLKRLWHSLQLLLTWMHTSSLCFVERISTFIRPILISCFYRFAATNWPIVIILFTVIELPAFTGKRQIIIDTDDTSVSVICQIFHEFSIQLAKWVMQ